MDKLEVINRALANSDNDGINALNDGSVEWQVTDQAFERAIEYLIARHNWPFAQVSAELVLADAADNPSQEFDHAFLLPTTLVHLKRVRVAGSTTDRYELVGRYICLDYDDAVTIEGFAMPKHEAFHPLAAEIITIFVEAGCHRGLNGDHAEGRHREADAEALLIEARPRVTSQNPARNAFVSSVSAARSFRRGSSLRRT